MRSRRTHRMSFGLAVLLGVSARPVRHRDLSRRPRYVILAIAVLLALIEPAATVRGAQPLPYAVTTPASSIASPSDFRGQSVRSVDLPDPADLGDRSYWVITGVPESGGYRYPFAIRAFTGVVFFRELAVDPANNRILMEVGSTSTPPPSMITAPAGSASSRPASAGAGGVSASPLSLVNTNGYFYTYWVDPANLVLNAVADIISWTYNTSTGKVSNLVYSDSRQWASWNGWAEIYHYNSGYYNSNSTVGTGYTNATYRTSSWFPLPTCGTTTTYYAANNAYGYGNGNIGGGVNTWSTSGCLFLLRYYGYAGR